ncbi:DNA-binding protein hu-alpha [Mycoplasma haemofelis str. Langford 1]|uniref:DNA-binding protein hu-alpha n=1 Tax=Mycoplasma haemofelis (strain Langford 1) TaxID=941640 RepID=E8ZK27_MYCHL|nr:HU family DNA-binding protein [Mycoplasma haemofelis]CBY93498.1 DNA-binding protein hu-alpha [Mycoplasma haemofelis str. Langford 1]
MLNKKDLLSKISKESNLSMKQVQDVLNSYQKTILEELMASKEVVVLDLGKFKVSQRSARTGINPLTKKPIEIPAKDVPKLVPSRKFKGLVEGEVKVDEFDF